MSWPRLPELVALLTALLAPKRVCEQDCSVCVRICLLVCCVYIHIRFSEFPSNPAETCDKVDIDITNDSYGFYMFVTKYLPFLLELNALLGGQYFLYPSTGMHEYREACEAGISEGGEWGPVASPGGHPEGSFGIPRRVLQGTFEGAHRPEFCFLVKFLIRDEGIAV